MTTGTGTPTDGHVHDSHQCPEHMPGCGCPDLGEWLCNPYWVSGHCPDALLVMPDDPRHEESRER